MAIYYQKESLKTNPRNSKMNKRILSGILLLQRGIYTTLDLQRFVQQKCGEREEMENWRDSQ